MRFGAGPSRAGQFLRTSSWLAPMPPEVTTTAWAATSNEPTSVRELASPRATPLGSRIPPRTPVTTPPVTTRSSTRCRNRRSIRPRSAAARTRAMNGPTTPGPVPQVMWNRGTELPWPVAVYPPRSAQPTTGKKPMPCCLSQARFSPAANSRYASAHCRGQWSESRSKPAVPNQSCRASSRESCTRSRRCSGESTRNSPPNDHQAWPPKDASGSCSSRITRLPASASSAVATSPARPAPTTTTSASLLPLSVLTLATLAGTRRGSPSPRGAVPLGGAALLAEDDPLADLAPRREGQAASRPDGERSHHPQARESAERAEDERQHAQRHQHPDGAGRQHEPAPATAPENHPRAGRRTEEQHGQDDDDPVQPEVLHQE